MINLATCMYVLYFAFIVLWRCGKTSFTACTTDNVAHISADKPTDVHVHVSPYFALRKPLSLHLSWWKNFSCSLLF